MYEIHLKSNATVYRLCVNRSQKYIFKIDCRTGRLHKEVTYRNEKQNVMTKQDALHPLTILLG